MRHLFGFLLLCGLSAPAFGQARAEAWLPLAADTHRITYEATVPVAGASQAELLARTQAWASHRHSASPPDTLHAAPTGVVVVLGTEEMIFPRQETLVRQPLHYTATISVAEGSYQYRITDFVLESAGPTPSYVPAEVALLPAPPTKAAATDLYYVRTAFEEATAQLLGTLQISLAPPPAEADN